MMNGDDSSSPFRSSKAGLVMINITEQEFQLLAQYIRKHFGIYLKKEKTKLLTGRLYQVLQKHGFTNFTEYYRYLISDKSGRAAAELIDHISTGHTHFMREPGHFFFFRDHVLPYLEKHVKDRDLRIWSAGCSTGEEPYTLAIIMDEFFGAAKMSWDTKILATDISEKVLNIARAGLYKKENVSKLPSLWVMKYFTARDSQHYEIKSRIKKEIIFRKFNLKEKHFPFKKKFHVIFCRNVMIYFDYETKAELIQKFYDVLADGGYLFIGHSESLSGFKTGFKYIQPAVYRK